MKKILQDRLSEIQAKLSKNISPMDSQIWNAQASLIIGVMNEYEEKMKRPVIEDIMKDYSMGLLTADETISKVAAISVEY